MGVLQTAEAEARLARLRAQIAQASAFAGRSAGEVHLLAVSKTCGAEQIRPFLLAGQRAFGENRVQEALGKWPALREEFADVELHLIGPLQTNKVYEAVQFFDVIQTLDREKLAAGLAKEIKRLAPERERMAQGLQAPERERMAPRLYVQVNTGEEEQKAGIAPQHAVEFVERCRSVHGLSIEGLMCIPPVNAAPGPHFALLGKLACEAGVKELSMGMSADFEQAIWLGATHVRLGSALFCERA